MASRSPEPQVLNYQTVQQRVFPWLATAYAYYFAGMHIRNMYFVVNGEIQEGNVDMLPEVSNLKTKMTSFTLFCELSPKIIYLFQILISSVSYMFSCSQVNK